jgi:hypothetical protein
MHIQIPVFRKILFAGLALATSGCAILHHVQLGQIDNRNTEARIPFEVLMSETGVSTEEVAAMGRASRSQGGNSLGDAAAILALFQIGPKTGAPVYNPRYAERLVYEIHQKCPTGRVTALTSIREMRKYPVVSGEIVKVTGFCLKTRTPASENKNDLTDGVL